MHFILSLLKLCAKTHLKLNYFIFNGYFDSLALFSYSVNRVLCWKMFLLLFLRASLASGYILQLSVLLSFCFYFCYFFCPKSSHKHLKGANNNQSENIYKMLIQRLSLSR